LGGKSIKEGLVMQAYSIDLRQRVLEDCDAGGSTREVALKYRVSESWVRRLKQRRREHGEVAPRRSGNPQPPRWQAHAEQLEQLVAEQPDATLSELQQRLGTRLSPQTLSRALRALQLTFKKKSFRPQNKIVRTFKSVAPPGKPR
jgi:transposase